MDEELEFDAPAFHDFGAASDEEPEEDDFFDPRRLSMRRQSMASQHSYRSSLGGDVDMVATIEEGEEEDAAGDANDDDMGESEEAEEGDGAEVGTEDVSIALVEGDNMAGGEDSAEQEAQAESEPVQSVAAPPCDATAQAPKEEAKAPMNLATSVSSFAKPARVATPRRGAAPGREAFAFAKATSASTARRVPTRSAPEAAKEEQPATRRPSSAKKYASPSSRLLAPTRASSARQEAVAQKRSRGRVEADDAEEETDSFQPAAHVLTEPKSPTFRTKARAHVRSFEVNSRMSSTSRELQEIAAAREQAAKRRRRNAAAVERLRAGPSPSAGATRSTKSLTVPVDVPLRTSARQRSAAAAASMSSAIASATSASAAANAALRRTNKHNMSLRTTPARRRRASVATSAPSQSATPRGPTEAKPFRFQTSARAQIRRSVSGTADQPRPEQYHSLAEKVQQFQESVPKRFHTKPVGHAPSPVKASPRGLTEPQPFHLETENIGASDPKVLSTEEQELQYLASVKPFKARGFNARVAKSCGDLGVPKVPKRELTAPTEFHLHTESRSAMRRCSEDGAGAGADAGASSFKATALNTKILAGPTFMPQVIDDTVTVPHSPMLMTKTRAGRRPPAEAPAEPEPKPFKARPIYNGPAFSASSKPVERRELTEPQPFNLTGPDMSAAAKAELEARIAREEEQAAAARKFKARPLPASVDDPARVFHPQPAKMPLTEPTEPAMPGSAIHAARRQEFIHSIEREMEAEAAQFSSFRAKPLPASIDAPSFVPKRSDAQPTAPAPFPIHTDTRAEQRAEFDEAVRRQQEEAAAREAEARAEKEKEDAENLRALRKQLQFKAKPISHGKSSFVQVSKKTLTMPMSPRLGPANRRSPRATRPATREVL